MNEKKKEKEKGKGAFFAILCTLFPVAAVATSPSAELQASPVGGLPGFSFFLQQDPEFDGNEYCVVPLFFMGVPVNWNLLVDVLKCIDGSRGAR